MSTIDIIILVCFIPALVQGITKGFISQLVALLSLIIGVWASVRFTSAICSWAMPFINANEQILKVIIFIVIIVVVMLLLYLAGKLIKSIIKLVMMGWLDRLLGVVFAFLKAFIIVGIIILLFSAINDRTGLVQQSALDSSIFYNPLEDVVRAIFPHLKQLVTG